MENETLLIALGKKFPSDLSNWKPTKRNFMGALVSIFDPLGLLGPLLVNAKLFLQNLWRQKYSWDEILPTDEGNYARKTLPNFSGINNFSFPRQLFLILIISLFLLMPRPEPVGL